MDKNELKRLIFEDDRPEYDSKRIREAAIALRILPEHKSETEIAICQLMSEIQLDSDGETLDLAIEPTSVQALALEVLSEIPDNVKSVSGWLREQMLGQCGFDEEKLLKWLPNRTAYVDRILERSSPNSLLELLRDAYREWLSEASMDYAHFLDSLPIDVVDSLYEAAIE